MFRLSFPRIANFAAVALVLGILYFASLRNNTAQEPSKPDAALSTAVQTTAAVSATPDAVTVPTQTVPAEQPKTDASKAESNTDTAKKEEPKKDEPKKDTETKDAAAKDTAATSPFPATDIPVESNKSAFGSPDLSSEQAKTLEQLQKEQAEKVAAEEAAKKAEEWKHFNENLKVWGIFLAVVILCFIAGNYIAVKSRLPEHRFRSFILFLSFFGSLTAVILGWHHLTLGIDLRGGVVLVYDVKASASRRNAEGDTDAKTGGLSQKTMDQLTTAIAGRINPGGVREIAITGLGGNKQVQVIIPQAEDAEVDRIQRIISESGALEFRILASPLYQQDEDIIVRAKREQDGWEIRTEGRLLAKWVPVSKKEESSFLNDSDIVTRQHRGQLEVLILYNDGFDVTGKYLTYVGEGNDGSQAGVSFEFDGIGENKFKRLTSANRPDPAQSRLKRKLGIVLNESLYSAPYINDVIGKRGIITFGQRHTEQDRQQLRQDIQDLIQVLDAGALPADLDKVPVSRQLIGATLGADTIQKGKFSLIVSAVLVLVFMLTYYHFAGFIACFCVITNLLMLIAIMLALRAAFTLPGLAGLALTVGMAVDANILIYERLREELQAGSSLRMAIHNAYNKALSAIVDSNLTTIIVGIILYAIGTEQVKGFAVTLCLGVALSMFTAIYCARTIMDLMEAQRSIKTFSMFQLFKRPNINFLGARYYLYALSTVMVIVSIIAAFTRGSSIFDIDFVGGVSAEVVFKEPQEIGYVRSALYEKDKTIPDVAKRLNDLAVQNVQSSETGDAASGSIGGLKQKTSISESSHFIITTSIPQVHGQEILSNDYLLTVRGIIRDTFGDKLKYSSLNYAVKPAEKKDGVEITMQFFPPINYESLRSLMKDETAKAVADKRLERDFTFDLKSTDDGYSDESTKPFANWTMTAQTTNEVIEKILSPMKTEMESTPYFPTSTTVGGSVAKSTRTAGLLAIGFSLLVIIAYIRVRFSNFIYGLVAALGLLHDVIVTLGCIALSVWVASSLSFMQVEEFKIGLPTVAAFLTIIGYSLNDTIIIFDRIRENKGKSPYLSKRMINLSVNQTLSRTVLTAGTTLISALVLYFWGGQGIHTFAFTMSAGVILGTYSTFALCAPLLWEISGKEEPSKENDK